MIGPIPAGCIAVIGGTFLPIGNGQAQEVRIQDAPLRAAFGNWSRDDGQARVRMAPCGKSLCATNIWIRDAASSEKVGDRLVMDLKPSGAASWNGTAYDPQRKLTYSMTMTFTSGKLQTRGCVLGGMICRNVGWTRFN
jgi:Uncharacterized protein conserved in bacteria